MKLTMRSVKFSYGEKAIFSDLNLELVSGERIAIMGPSGSGKTTLLHLAAGLLRPQCGLIARSPHDSVAMVFQEDRLIPQLTALKNVSFTAPLESDTVIHSLLGQVGLMDVADCFPSQLSGGMKRRSAVVRAIASRSDYLLLDEPFNGLDDQAKAVTADFILRNTVDKIILTVIHNEQDAALLGAKVVLLDTLDRKK